MIRSLILITALLACACARQPAPVADVAAVLPDDALADEVPNDQGQPFITEVMAALEHADRVVLVEHSFETDFPTTPGPNDPPSRERSYKRVELSEAQVSGLRNRLAAMSPHVASYVSACAYIPHHRLEFFRGKKRIQRMEICLTCGQLEWDGVHTTEPGGFYRTFSDFLKETGFEPDRNWELLARQPE